MKITARMLSEKYDAIFIIAQKEGTQKDFNKIPEAKTYNGLVIDLDDANGVVDTIKVDAQTIEEFFGVTVESEEYLNASYTPDDA